MLSLSLARWAGAGRLHCRVRCPFSWTQDTLSFPVMLLTEKAENAWQFWKMIDNLAYFGFLNRRKSSGADLVCYGGGGSDDSFFLCR